MTLSITQMREHTSKALEMFGRQVTIKRPTAVEDGMGRVASVSDTTIGTVTADIQYVTASDKEILAQGWAELGDAIGYFPHTYALQENDKVEFNSETWIVTKVVDTERVGSDLDFQQVVLRKS